MAKLVELGRRILAWCTKHKAISAVAIAALLLAVPVHHIFAADLWTEFTQNPLDATALILAGIIQNITAVLGKTMLLLIEMIVVPILGYDGFYDSNITNLGWSLVRDVVNMFVVVVLLVIAVMTIVGYSAANWTQQLPRLFIAIVLVNFSKLICGVFIDMSQVVMFTFVNAIVSIAAGNFAAMFGINTFGQFSADFLDRVNTEGSGIEAYMYLGSAYLNFVIYLAILSVIFMLAVAFLWRIVVLWILIIMSPLAFFMIGIKDIFHTAAGVFDTWKKKFVSALTFGPVLTFFLWLALAASSGSTLAQTEDFPMPDEPTDLGLPLEMFDLDNFLGMFLALAILLAGMQQASSMASGMGGFASAVISDKAGMGLVKGLARPFNTSKRLAKATVSGAKVGNTQVPGLANLAPGYTQKFGKMTAALGQRVSSAAGGGIISRTVGGALAGAGAFTVGAGKDVRKARNKAGAESAEHMTDAQKTAYNLALADIASGVATGDAEREKRGRGVLAQYGENELHGARTRELVTKEKAQRGLRKDLEEKYKGLTGAAKRDAVQQDFDNIMRQQLAMAQSEEGKAFLQLSGEEKDFVEDTLTANPHLIADPSKSEDERIEAITKHFQAMQDKGRLNVGAISAGAFTDTAARTAMQRFVRDGKDGKKASLWAEVESGKGTIAQRKAIIGLIGATDVAGANGVASVASLVRAGAVGDKDSDGGTTRRAAVISRIQSADGGGLDSGMRGAVAASLLNTGEYTPKQVFGDDFALLETDDDLESQIATGASAMVRADTASARHLSDIVREGAAPSAASFAASSVSRDDVKRLRAVAANQPGTDEGIRAEEALDVISRAVEIERNSPDAGEDHKKRMKGISDELVGRRYGRGTPRSDGDATGAAAAAAAAGAAAVTATRDRTKNATDYSGPRKTTDAPSKDNASKTPKQAPPSAAPDSGGKKRIIRRGGGGSGGGTPPPPTTPPAGPAPSVGPAPAAAPTTGSASAPTSSTPSPSASAPTSTPSAAPTSTPSGTTTPAPRERRTGRLAPPVISPPADTVDESFDPADRYGGITPSNPGPTPPPPPDDD